MRIGLQIPRFHWPGGTENMGTIIDLGSLYQGWGESPHSLKDGVIISEYSLLMGPGSRTKGEIMDMAGWNVFNHILDNSRGYGMDYEKIKGMKEFLDRIRDDAGPGKSDQEVFDALRGRDIRGEVISIIGCHLGKKE